MIARRGFTLVELMIALVLLLLVGGVLYQALVNTQRVSRAQTQHAQLQDNVRAGTLIIANELREVGYDQIPAAASLGGVGVPAGPVSDLITILADRIEYKAMRGIGFTCRVTSTKLTLPLSTFSRLRLPKASDSAAVYVEGDPNTSADDAWVHIGITNAPTTEKCPDGVTDGVAMTIGWPAWTTGAIVVPRMVVGGPVRIFEIMEMKSYQSDGRTWLGMRSVTHGEEVQPVVGPLADAVGNVRGLTFTYLDRNNVVTADRNAVRSIEIRLQGITTTSVRSTGMNTATVDSMAVKTQVALRNAPRP